MMGGDDNNQDDDVGATELARQPGAAGAAFHDVASGPATGRAHPGGTLAGDKPKGSCVNY